MRIAILAISSPRWPRAAPPLKSGPLMRLQFASPTQSAL